MSFSSSSSSSTSSSSYDLNHVLGLIGQSRKFGWKLYKKNLTVARHIGILVYLDGKQSFTVDFGVEEKGSGGVLLGQPKSSVTFSAPPYGFNIQLSGDYVQSFSTRTDADKELAKKIVKRWYNFEHGDYDLLVNNCRNFCKACMNIAKKRHPLNESGADQANTLLITTLVADGFYNAPLAPVHAIRGIYHALK